MATKSERLAALERKHAQITAQIQALKARENAQQRKDDTRRKVLVGAVVLRLVQDGKLPRAQFVQWLDEGLSQERDRRLFELAGLPALSPACEAGGAV